MNLPPERLLWLDIAKGLGIILVVVGHVLLRSPSAIAAQASSYIYLFHMPLFFVLAGITLKPTPWRRFAIHKVVTLLIPYAAFLVFFGIPSLVLSCSFGWTASDLGIDRCAVMPLKLMAGGSTLGGIFGAFWFIPCLLGALLLAQLMLERFGPTPRRLIAPACGLIVLAYALPYLFPPSTAILALGAVPMACLLVLSGYILKAQLPQLDRRTLLACASLALITAALCVSLDMKAANFGIPVLSIAGALALSGLSIALAQALAHRPPAASPLAALGQRSLTILYLHQTIHLGLRHAGLHNEALLVALALILPVMLHDPISRTLSRASAALAAHLSPNSPRPAPPLR